MLDPAATDADFASACALRDALLRTPICTCRSRRTRAATASARASSCAARPTPASALPAARRRDRRARAIASGAAGLRYAVETLLQLVDARGALPACSIDDAPDFAKRGIMLDVSRGKVPDARDAAARSSISACG